MSKFKNASFKHSILPEDSNFLESWSRLRKSEVFQEELKKIQSEEANKEGEEGKIFTGLVDRNSNRFYVGDKEFHRMDGFHGDILEVGGKFYFGFYPDITLLDEDYLLHIKKIN